MKEFSQAARKLNGQCPAEIAGKERCDSCHADDEKLADAMAIGAQAALNISQYAENPQLTDLQAVKVAAEAERLLTTNTTL